MRMRIIRRTGVFLCVFGIIMWLAAGLMLNASAASAESSLTLICRMDKVILSGMQWSLYRVGSRSGNSFVLEGEFADYPVSLEDMSASAVSAAADTLENYAVLDRISPIAQGETGNDGLLKFDGLEPGLYMTCGKKLVVGDTTYLPSALLVEIEMSGEGGQTNFDLNAYPKLYYKKISYDISTFTVRKIWENDENVIHNRAASISVEIYKDLELWDTVVLDESNDWSYSWAYSSSPDWRVKEAEVPDGYTVIYRSNDTQFAIVNTYSREPETTEPVTSLPDEPSSAPAESSTSTKKPVIDYSEIESTVSSESTVDKDKDSSTAPPAASSESENKLPQTGQLWWPVPILLLCGAVFIALGCRLNFGNKKDDDQ